jgi:hypothetical protein
VSSKHIPYSVIARAPGGEVAERSAPNFAQAMVIARELQGCLRQAAVWIQPSSASSPPEPAHR